MLSLGWIGGVLIAGGVVAAFLIRVRTDARLVEEAWSELQSTLWSWHLQVADLIKVTSNVELIDETLVSFARSAQAGARRPNGPLVQGEAQDLLLSALGPLVDRLQAVVRSERGVHGAAEALDGFNAGIEAVGAAVRRYNQAVRRYNRHSEGLSGALLWPLTRRGRQGLFRSSLTQFEDAS